MPTGQRRSSIAQKGDLGLGDTLLVRTLFDQMAFVHFSLHIARFFLQKRKKHLKKK